MEQSLPFASNKLLIVSRRPVVRAGLTSWAAEWSWELAGVLSELRSGTEMVSRTLPQIALIDLADPHEKGIKAIQLCAARGVGCVAFAVDSDRRVVRSALRAGARGYLLEDSPPEEVLSAVDAVREGRPFFCSRTANVVLEILGEPEGAAPQRDSRLSPRETEVLAAIAAGRTSKEIAATLGISYRTVEAHRQRVSEKLGIRTIAGLTEFAIQNGLQPRR